MKTAKTNLGPNHHVLKSVFYYRQSILINPVSSMVSEILSIKYLGVMTSTILGHITSSVTYHKTNRHGN